MAEDIRTGDTGNGGLSAAHEALKRECAEQSRNALYTSTTFYIWLRWLRRFRAAIWIAAVAASGAAASTALSKYLGLEVLVAGLALLGVILPGVIKALKIDDTISAYEDVVARYKIVEGALRRAANIWSHKPFAEFEVDARRALSDLDDARRTSLTPPEWCFRSAHKKVKSGDYDPDKAN